MIVLAWVLLLVAAVAVGVAVYQAVAYVEATRVPRRKPSEVVGNLVPLGDVVQVEGHLQPGLNPLRAPISARPCLAYEVTVERRWAKVILSERGKEQDEGRVPIVYQRVGCTFQLTDGAAAVQVDGTERVEGPFAEPVERIVAVEQPLPRSVRVDDLEVLLTPDPKLDPFTVQLIVRERIVGYAPTVMVEAEVVERPRGRALAARRGAGSLTLRLTSMRQLRIRVVRRAIAGAGVGVCAAALGVGLLRRVPVAEVTDVCPQVIRNDVLCSASVRAREPFEATWTVERSGSYEVRVLQPPAGPAFYPLVRMMDEQGRVVATASSLRVGDEASLARVVPAGTYRLEVTEREGLELAKPLPFTLGVGFARADVHSLPIQMVDAGPPVRIAPAATPSAAAGEEVPPNASSAPAATAAPSAGASPSAAGSPSASASAAAPSPSVSPAPSETPAHAVPHRPPPRRGRGHR